MKLNDKQFYEDNTALYDILSDYVHEEHARKKVSLIDGVASEIDIDLEDCILKDGELYVPIAYDWIHKGTSVFDDPDEYKPIYPVSPTLTKLEIQNMLAKEAELDINNPINHL